MPWRALLAACAALIVYGSLYPFHYATPPSAAAAWDAFLANHALWTNRADVVGNVLLFVPLGALGVLALPPRARGAATLACLALASVAFAFVVQVVQIWFPPRDAALADVWWNAVGTALGMAAALPLARRAASVPPREARAGAAGLLLLWIVTQWAPLVPTLDWQSIKDNLKPALLHPSFALPAVLLATARVLAAGCLFAELRVAQRHAAWRFALLLAVVVGVKPFIVDQAVDASHLAGFALGYAAWLSLARRPDRRLSAALWTLFLAYTVSALTPLAWRDSPAPLHVLPFEALLEGSLETNTRALLEAVFVYATLLWGVGRAGGRVFGTSVALALWVALMELAQTWIEGRTADLTEALVVLAIGYAMRDRQPRAHAPARHVRRHRHAQGSRMSRHGKMPASSAGAPPHDDHDSLRRPR